MVKRKHPSISGTGEPLKTNDLKLINGIGPAVESRLHKVGIYTFAQLAALSPADIAASVSDVAGLTAERIIKQNWIGQARSLALEKSKGIPIDELEEGEIQKHPLFAISEPLTSTEHPQAITTLEEPEPVLLDVEGPVHSEVPDLVSGVISESPSPDSLVKSSKLTGTLRVREMKLIGAESDSLRALMCNEPFDVHLTLDLTDLQVPGNTSLHYKVSIFGKDRGSRSGLIIGKAKGTITLADTVSIKVEGNTLPAEGNYLIGATIIVGLSANELKVRHGTTAIIDGGQVQVL